MKQVVFNDIDNEARPDTILHTHEPFVKDYLCLQGLLRYFEIKSVFEIGTHIGEGTQIILNAVPEATVYSLDLPVDEYEKSKQHPKYKGMFVGQMNYKGYKQLYGDSMTFDYSNYPCEAYFIDGEHDYRHPYHETQEILKQKPKLIIWHDADMPEVYNAITDSFEWNKDYNLFRVYGTRIAYAIRI